MSENSAKFNAKEQEIYEFLKKSMVELFEILPDKITPQARLYEDLEIDSIDAIDMIDMLKKFSGHRMSPSDFKEVRSIADIVRVVAAQMVADGVNLNGGLNSGGGENLNGLRGGENSQNES